jgi:hypothetical protein
MSDPIATVQADVKADVTKVDAVVKADEAKVTADVKAVEAAPAEAESFVKKHAADFIFGAVLFVLFAAAVAHTFIK